MRKSLEMLARLRPYPLFSKDPRENGQRGWDMTSLNRSEVKTRRAEKRARNVTKMSEAEDVDFASLSRGKRVGRAYLWRVLVRYIHVTLISAYVLP